MGAKQTQEQKTADVLMFNPDAFYAQLNRGAEANKTKWQTAAWNAFKNNYRDPCWETWNAAYGDKCWETHSPAFQSNCWTKFGKEWSQPCWDAHYSNYKDKCAAAYPCSSCTSDDCWAKFNQNFRQTCWDTFKGDYGTMCQNTYPCPACPPALVMTQVGSANRGVDMIRQEQLTESDRLKIFRICMDNPECNAVSQNNAGVTTFFRSSVSDSAPSEIMTWWKKELVP